MRNPTSCNCRTRFHRGLFGFLQIGDGARAQDQPPERGRQVADYGR
jgi:hypothetical protein